MKHQALLTIQTKLKLAINFFQFYFSVAIDSREILASVWQEEENFEVLNSKGPATLLYPTVFNYFFAVLLKSC